MPKFSVIASYYASINIEVEAKDADESLEKAAEVAKTKKSYDEAAECIQFDEVHSPELVTIK
jgi:hypothetical protein